MSTDSSPAKQSNETKLFNLTTTDIVNIVNIISVFASFSNAILQYLASKPSSSFYGINSELLHSQPSRSTIIGFFISTLVKLAIFLTPLIVADYYRNSLKTIKEGSNNKEKTVKILYPLLFTIIFFYSLLSGCYILKKYASLFDSFKKGCAFIIICIVILLILLNFLLKMHNEYQAGKDKNWCLEEKISLCCFILCNLILWWQLFHIMGINILLLLILCSLFIIYFFATLYSFLDKNKFFLCTSILCFIILALCIIIIPLSSGNTYHSGKKQYEIAVPISSSTIDSDPNLKVVILHKNNQLLLMDFRISTDENTKDGSAPSKENETQAKQSIEEILSKASESNLNIKKGEYTIQDENLYKFYTVTFKGVNCE